MNSESAGGGMTDMQFKFYLMNLQEDWQRIADLAAASDAKEIQAEAEKQIRKIISALRL